MHCYDVIFPVVFVENSPNLGEFILPLEAAEQSYNFIIPSDLKERGQLIFDHVEATNEKTALWWAFKMWGYVKKDVPSTYTGTVCCILTKEVLIEEVEDKDDESDTGYNTNFILR